MEIKTHSLNGEYVGEPITLRGQATLQNYIMTSKTQSKIGRPTAFDRRTIHPKQDHDTPGLFVQA